MRLRLLIPLPLALLCLAADPIPAQTSMANSEAGHEETLAQPHYKSERAAIGLSVLGTAVPILAGTQISGDGDLADILIIGGMLVGPSLGQFYAGSPLGGGLGIGIRTGGFSMTLLGLFYLLDNVFCMESEGDACDDNNDGAAAPLLILGTATYLGGAIYSMVDASRAVERYNARQDNKRVFGWSPILIPGTGGSMRTGALAYVRF